LSDILPVWYAVRKVIFL